MVKKTTKNPNISKIKIGAKIRRLRRDAEKTQAQLAGQMNISASYLNLIEHNHRKVTVAMLLKLSEIFNLELADLADGDESQLLSDLMEVLSNDMFEDLDLTNIDVRELVSASPNAGKALLLLHDAYHKTIIDARSMAAKIIDEDGDNDQFSSFSIATASDQISDFFQNNNNYFQDIEDEAIRIGREINIISTQSNDILVDYLKAAHEVHVAIRQTPTEEIFHRRYDPSHKILELSIMSSASNRNFQLAHQIGLLSAKPVIDMLIMEANIRDKSAISLARIALANYFAAALLMPYDQYITDARNLRYDIEYLQHQYNVSFEQAAQRLSSLNAPNNKGIPLHFLRIDMAGNISKRFSLSGLPIPRHGTACSKWNIYSAAINPNFNINHIKVQLSRLHDGTEFLCIAKTIRKGGIGFGVEENFLTIGLGCNATHANGMVYFDNLNIGGKHKYTEIGVSCRICDRQNCIKRAFPPMHNRFHIDENQRGASPYISNINNDAGGTR